MIVVSYFVIDSVPEVWHVIRIITEMGFKWRNFHDLLYTVVSALLGEKMVNLKLWRDSY